MVQYDIDGSIEDDKEFVKEQLRVVYVDYMEYTVEIHRVGDPAYQKLVTPHRVGDPAYQAF